MRHVSPITQPGYRLGVPNPNKGKRFAVDILKPEEIEAMKDGCNVGAMGLRNRAVLDTLHGIGCRVGEFCNLKVRDIDLETRAFRIYGTKTKNADRSVGCNPVAFASIRDWLDVRETLELPGPYAFPCLSVHERGNKIKPAQIRQMIHNLAGKAGIEGPHTDRRVHPHAFRHSFAAALAGEGRPAVDLEGARPFVDRRHADLHQPRRAVRGRRGDGEPDDVGGGVNTHPTRSEPTYEELRAAGTTYVVCAVLVVLTGVLIVVFNLFMSLSLAVVLSLADMFLVCVVAVVRTAWKAARS